MARKNTNILDTRSRIIIGAIGGIAPLIISLLVVDVRSLVNDLAMMDAIGLAVRCLVLVFIGALVGYLHNNEEEPFKVFQLGIAAPALLTTAINGYGVVGSGTSSFKELKTSYTEPQQTWTFALIPSAHAAEAKTTSSRKYFNANAFQEPKISNFERFLRGLIGYRVSSSGDDWFVIAGSHTNEEKARKQVREFRKKNYMAKVYQPSNGSKYFAVVIGANLTMHEAQTLRKNAIYKGLPKDTYLWRK